MSIAGFKGFGNTYDEIIEDADIDLKNCQANKVHSKGGSITWTNKCNSLANSIIAEKKIDLRCISAATIESKEGEIRAMLGKIDQAKAKDKIFFMNMTATISRSSILNLGMSSVTTAIAAKVYLSAKSSIKQLIIHLPEGKEGLIEGAPESGEVGSIFVTRREAKDCNDSIGKANTILNATGNDFSYKLNERRIFKFDGSFNSDGTVPGTYAQTYKMFAEEGEICKINDLFFKLTLGEFVPVADPATTSLEKVVMTEKEMEEYLYKTIIKEGENYLQNVSLMQFEGGNFSILDNKISVVKLPAHWEITEVSKKVLEIKGAVQISGDIRFDGLGGEVKIAKEAIFTGNLINGIKTQLE